MSACIDLNQNAWDAYTLFVQFKCIQPTFSPSLHELKDLGYNYNIMKKVKKMQSTNHQFRITARTASSHCYLSITSKLTTEYHLDWFPNVRPQRVIKLILGCINTCIRTSNYSKQCTTNPWDHKFLLLSRNHTSSDIDKLLRTKILAEYQTFKVVSQENKT